MAKYTAIGNTVAPAELRFTPSGHPVCNFTVAESVQKYDKQQNAWVDDYTNFWPCTVWGQDAEHAADTLTDKGMRVIVTGDLKTRTWQDKDGGNRSRVELDRCEVGLSAKFGAVTRAPRGGGRPSGFNDQQGGFGAPQGGFGRTGFQQPTQDDQEPPF